MSKLTDRIAINDIERAMDASDLDDLWRGDSTALRGLEDRIELLGYENAMTVLRHRASASRAHKVELADLRAARSDAFRARRNRQLGA